MFINVFFLQSVGLSINHLPSPSQKVPANTPKSSGEAKLPTDAKILGSPFLRDQKSSNSKENSQTKNQDDSGTNRGQKDVIIRKNSSK
jgi:hypothetical protein